jgi:hypothetical protein
VLDEGLRRFHISHNFFKQFVVWLIYHLYGYPSSKKSQQKVPSVLYLKGGGFQKEKVSPPFFFLKSVSRRREKQKRLRRDAAFGNAPNEKTKPALRYIT